MMYNLNTSNVFKSKPKRILQNDNRIQKYSGVYELRYKINSNYYFCHKIAAQSEENVKTYR
jgi:hypothetical protein